MPTCFRIVKTDAGFVGLAASDKGLRRVTLPAASQDAAQRDLRKFEPDATEDRKLLPELAAALGRFFTGEPVDFSKTRIDWSGHADFEVRTWRALARVPYGKTTSYKGLAERLGSPGAARAIGRAMGRNPCPIVIPCHRVLKSDGSIGGWSGPGGLGEKRRMLEMEAQAGGEMLVR